MKPAALLLAALTFALPARGQQTEIDRALIQRDRQSAEFSRPELRDLHQRRDMQQTPPRPDERAAQARERDAYPSPVPPQGEQPGFERPLPLPGGQGSLVDPIPLQGVRP